MYDVIEALEVLEEEWELTHREAVLLRKMKKKVNWLKDK